MASKARNIADLLNASGKVTADDLDVGQIGGRRNLIINGGFDVWQRGTSWSDVTNGQYVADRFFVQKTGTTPVSRVSCSVDGFDYALRQEGSASSLKHLQIIEKNPSMYAGQTFTLSVWVRGQRSDGTGAISIGTVYDGASTLVGGSTFYDLSSTWKKYTVTFTLPSEPSSYLRVQVSGSATGAGDYLETTGWQLELGSVATPFEHRSYGEELALCQRYYEHGLVQGTAAHSNTGYVVMRYAPRVEKRAAPSVTMGSVYIENAPSGSQSNSAGWNADGSGTGYPHVVCTHYPAVSYYGGPAKGFAKITMDAEL